MLKLSYMQPKETTVTVRFHIPRTLIEQLVKCQRLSEDEANPKQWLVDVVKVKLNSIKVIYYKLIVPNII